MSNMDWYTPWTLQYLQAMAESVTKMKARHGLDPDYALIDGPYAPLALKENPQVEVQHPHPSFPRPQPRDSHSS